MPLSRKSGQHLDFLPRAQCLTIQLQNVVVLSLILTLNDNASHKRVLAVARESEHTVLRSIVARIHASYDD